MFRNIKKIHFIGIGGIGMSGIAELLYNKGYKVTGSDNSLNDVTNRLLKLGLEIFEGHSAKNITDDVDVVVYSSAVPRENPEIQEALRKNIPAVKRSEMLAEVMRTQYGICIAGTHGKTTTTSMTALTFINAKLDPTVIVGGILSELDNSNSRLGKGEYIVVEADEYDRTFLKLTPTVAALTTLEVEHLDTYKDLEDIKASFIEFANKVPFYGFVAVCIDEPNLVSIIPLINAKVFTYSIEQDADLRAVDIICNQFSSEFNVQYYKENLGRIKLNVPGKHNIKNALAVITIAIKLGIDFNVVKKSLESYKGALRRFQIKYDEEILVVDDYAHHPTEVLSTISGIKDGWNRRLIAVFQPHLFTRTRDFAEDFGKAFLKADVFICTGIYPAREKPIKNITGELIANVARTNGHQNVIYEEDKNNIPELLLKQYRKGDIIITMGAGDIYKYGEKFIQLLNEKKIIQQHNE